MGLTKIIEKLGRTRWGRTIRNTAIAVGISVPLLVYAFTRPGPALDLRVPGEATERLMEQEEKPKEARPHRKKKVNSMLGVNYSSWTSGEYPYTAPWKSQTFFGSQGIVSADITETNPWRGRGSLELQIDTTNGSASKNGEVLLDLRYKLPRYDANKPIKIKRDEHGKPIGVNLSGKTLGAMVYCELGTANTQSNPNGLQLFAKSYKIVGGKEVWSSYYGNWHNIWGDRCQRHMLADRELGDIWEGHWRLISARLPYPGEEQQARFGHIEDGFDASRVAAIGIKFGLSPRVHQDMKKKIFVDRLGWLDIKNPGNPQFELYHLSSWGEMFVWENFTKMPARSVKVDNVFCRGTFIPHGDCAAFYFEDTRSPVEVIRESGYDTLAIVQTEYMQAPGSEEIVPHPRKTHTNTELEKLIECAHAEDLEVVLKPHVDVLDNSWRGNITPEDASEWFENYRDFILHYAELSEKNHVGALVVGTELKSMAGSEHRKEWEGIFQDVRSVYRGKLVYAANWDNYRNLCFPDLVDAMGVNGYFPLSGKRNPSMEDLLEGWKPWVAKLEKYHNETGNDIIITEIGYRSTDYAAREPWEYTEQRAPNQELQARCYRAMLGAFEEKPWFKGALIWNWLPRKDYGGKHDTGFTPQHKAAQEAFTGGGK